MLLGFIFLVFSFLSFVSWLIFTGNFIYFPALYRIGNFFALFIIPVIYLYVRTVIKSNSVRLWDLLHFLPALIFFIDHGLDREKYELEKVKSKSDKVENLSVQKIKEIEVKLEKVLVQEKKFLQRGYSIHTLSEDIGIPSYLLTIYLNQRLQTNFSDLINEKRIEECCELISSGKYDYLSLLGIAELSGFNNRNSFTQAFQKFKNVSPSLYIKAQKTLSKNKND